MTSGLERTSGKYDGSRGEASSRLYALPKYQRHLRQTRRRFLRIFSSRADVSGIHVLRRSYRRDPKIGSVLGSWDIRERTVVVASPTARESKNPGTRAAKSSISLSSSRDVSVHSSALARTVDLVLYAPRSTLFRRPCENHCQRSLTFFSSASLRC